MAHYADLLEEVENHDDGRGPNDLKFAQYSLYFYFNNLVVHTLLRSLKIAFSPFK